MKKLISAEDVEYANSKNEKTIYISNNTIVTLLAEELAKSYNIEISLKEKPSIIEDSSEKSNLFNGEFDMDKMYQICSLMKDKGILNELLELLSPKPYIEEGEAGGLRIIRGDSVKYQTYDTGNANDKVFYQEIASKDDSSIRAGFLTIEHSKFERKSKCMEVGYIIEGKLSVEINGNNFVVYPGDIFYIPSNSKIIWNSKEKTKLFYIKDLKN